MRSPSNAGFGNSRRARDEEGADEVRSRILCFLFKIRKPFLINSTKVCRTGSRRFSFKGAAFESASYWKVSFDELFRGSVGMSDCWAFYYPVKFVSNWLACKFGDALEQLSSLSLRRC